MLRWWPTACSSKIKIWVCLCESRICFLRCMNALCGPLGQGLTSISLCAGFGCRALDAPIAPRQLPAPAAPHQATEVEFAPSLVGWGQWESRTVNFNQSTCDCTDVPVPALLHLAPSEVNGCFPGDCDGPWNWLCKVLLLARNWF